ncbi:MAG: thioredoxin domain-containing protein [Bryobacteraceae bacterium]|nr:thioredoxin domain-containing protein [Bryobacteraceae bacterium]
MSELYTGIVEFTDRTLEQGLAAIDRPVLLDFGASWCSPCHALEPIIKAIAAERGTRVTVVKVDLERSPIAARSFGILSIPTVLIFRQGKVRERLVGVQSKATYLAAIDRVLKN